MSKQQQAINEERVQRKLTADQEKKSYSILKDFDQDCNDNLLGEFFKIVKDMQFKLNIQSNNDDPFQNLVESLGKIESQIHYYCEIRNYLHQHREKEVNDLEKKIQSDRATQKIIDNRKAEEQKRAELTEQQRKKALKIDKINFVGKKVQGRSTKQEMKRDDKKQDTMDEQTKAEKEYLGPDLF